MRIRLTSSMAREMIFPEGKAGPMRKLVIAAALLAATTTTACGGGSNTQEVHGQVLGGTQSAATVLASMGGSGICGGAVAGTQVIVKGPSGTLLATTTLHKAANQSGFSGLPASLIGQGKVGVYEFSTTIPAGNGPYTIQLVGVNSTVVSAKNLGHLKLTCR